MSTQEDLRGENAAKLIRVSSSLPVRPEIIASTLQLLIVDNDLHVLSACCEIAASIGFAVHAASTADQAREILHTLALDVVLMDLKVPNGGLPMLEEIRALRPRSSVVVMTAFATVASAVDAMRIGATDYLTKPFAMDELTGVLHRAAQRRAFELEHGRVQASLRTQTARSGLIGASPEMQKIERIVSKVALSSHPILILGESGTGKELVARSIYENGPNAARKFIVLECGQLSAAMLEGELFGYGHGDAARREKIPLLTVDGGGALYLDQVDEMSLDLQTKLLRALQDRQVRQPASNDARPVTVRLLASSTRNLSGLVYQGLFRKDLYYRLNVVSLRIPPLRERKEDIPLLVEHFLMKFRRESSVQYTLTPSAMQTLTGYEWPGNVRELESAIERACSLASGPVLHSGDLPTQLQQTGPADGESDPLFRVDEREEYDFNAGRPGPIIPIAELERGAILQTIRQLHGDKLMAAKLLGIGKTTLYRKLKEYGITES